MDLHDRNPLYLDLHDPNPIYIYVCIYIYLYNPLFILEIDFRFYHLNPVSFYHLNQPLSGI